MAAKKPPKFRDLPRAARLFLLALMAFAPIVVALASGEPGQPRLELGLLALVGVLCAAGNLLEVFAPGHYSFQINLAFFFWGAMLLPPWAVAVLAVLSFAPGWLLHRFRWYMTAFNVVNYTLAGVLAHRVVASAGALTSFTLADVGVVFAAAAAFVLLNHALLGIVISLAQARPLLASVRERLEGIPLDGALAMTGACLAAMWSVYPGLALLLAGPMFLVYRALWLPAVEHKARTDVKTGLYNSEHLMKELTDALNLARRRGSEVSLVMLDVDNLRLVNNRHGHLAGDRLIRGVADILKEVAGTDGIAARFGGEEFCLLLSDTGTTGARRVAEAARASVEALRVDSDRGNELQVTISAGIAGYPAHGDTPNALLHNADVAVYEAKIGGRNRVRVSLAPGAREILDRAGFSGPAPPPAPAGERLSMVGEETAPPPPATARADDMEREAVRPADEPERPGRNAGGPDPPARPVDRDYDRATLMRSLIPWYAGAVCAAAGGIALLASHAAIWDRPILFALLVASVLVLDLVRIDLFQRANISPASIATIALAMAFGPLGPIVSEALIAALRAARREPAIKWSWDLGALSIAGAAAAGVFSALPGESPASLILGGAAAGLAYYLVNMSLLSIVMGLSDARGPLAQWREGLAWLAPHYLAFGTLAGTLLFAEQRLGAYAMVVFGVPVAALWVAQKQYLDHSRKSVEELRSNADQLRSLLADREHLIGRMHRSYLSTIKTLARSIEARDPYTGGHTERVSSIAHALAARLGFDEGELRAVEVGSIIHDIGKIGIADQILLKQGQLDDAEYAEMRKHAEIATYILADLDLPPIVKQMARSHHERYDGSGYPDGLQREEIPIAARILTVADALDAMTSDRPYRAAMPLEAASAEIERQASSQFCPVVVSVLRDALEQDAGFRALFDDHHVAA